MCDGNDLWCLDSQIFHPSQLIPLQRRGFNHPQAPVLCVHPICLLGCKRLHACFRSYQHYMWVRGMCLTLMAESLFVLKKACFLIHSLPWLLIGLQCMSASCPDHNSSTLSVGNTSPFLGCGLVLSSPSIYFKVLFLPKVILMFNLEENLTALKLKFYRTFV